MCEATLKELEFVFGRDSRGSTPQLRAQSSNKIFTLVDDILYAGYRDATVFKAQEALRIFGFDVLILATYYGEQELILDQSCVSRVIYNHRRQKGYTMEELAAECRLNLSEIERAEDPNRTKIAKYLRIICPALGMHPNSLIVPMLCD